MIFDFDGTVADTESIEYRSVAAVFAEHGLEFGEDRWAHVIGQSWSPEWVGELAGEVLARGDEAPAADELHRRQHDIKQVMLRELVPRPGIVELLEAASHNGVPMGIASNSPLRWVEARLQQVGLAGHFSVLSTLDAASHPKPHPAPYLEACELLGARPGHSVAFEDSATGTASSVTAGLFTVVCAGPLTATHDLGAGHLLIDSHDRISLASLCLEFELFVSGR